MEFESTAKEEKQQERKKNSDVLEILEKILKYSLQEVILWVRKHGQTQDPALAQKEGLTDHLRFSSNLSFSQ